MLCGAAEGGRKRGSSFELPTVEEKEENERLSLLRHHRRKREVGEARGWNFGRRAGKRYVFFPLFRRCACSWGEGNVASSLQIPLRGERTQTYCPYTHDVQLHARDRLAFFWPAVFSQQLHNWIDRYL